jgi:pilus assembly protein CpaB
MNMKTVIPLGLAIVLAIVAAFVVRNMVAHRGTPVAVNSNLVPVVVARGDLEPGKALEKEDLVVAKVPAEIAPGHVFSDMNQLVGRVTIAPLSKGQTIMENGLAAAGTGAGLQALIPPGMRAITVEINEFSGVGGWLEPGCRVDLLANINDPKSHQTLTKTILQDVKVGAIGHNITTPHPVEGQPLPPPANNCTLILTPDQVQILQLAAMTSRPWLTLRGSRDNNAVALAPMSAGKLIGDGDTDPAPQQEQAVAPAPNPAFNPFAPVAETVVEAPKTITRTVTIIRGGVETKTSFTLPAPPVLPHAEPDTQVDTNSDQRNPAIPGQ